MEVTVVRLNLVEDVLWIVPLIEYVLDAIKLPVKPEPNRAFIGLSARITLHVQLHHSHYPRKGRPRLGVTQPFPSFAAGEVWGKARRLRAMVSRPLPGQPTPAGSWGVCRQTRELC